MENQTFLAASTKTKQQQKTKSQLKTSLAETQKGKQMDHFSHYRRIPSSKVTFSSIN